jgi:recombination protein RecT
MTNTDILNNSVGIIQENNTLKKVVQDALNKNKQSLMALMPAHVNKDALIKVAISLASKPDYADCSPVSFLQSYATAAQLGLQPNSPLGHCYLLPFFNKGKKEVQLILGFKGMIDIARRSGQIESINAYIVYKSDEFNLILGVNPNIVHIPNLSCERQDSEISLVYAVAKLIGGGTQFEYLTMADIAKCRKSSKSKIEYSPWSTHFSEMCKKTAIRKLFKYLPVSLEISKAILADEQSESVINDDLLLNDLNTIDLVNDEVADFLKNK